MLPGMLTICLTWVVLFLALSGLGFIGFRFCRLSDSEVERVFDAFWLGFVLLIATLQLWHLWAPIGLAAFVCIGTVGLTGAGIHAGVYGRLFRKQPTAFFLGVGALAVVALWLSNRAMGPIDPYDAGLYHLPTMKWISSYRIVPGLGNLHCRFAILSSYFAYLVWLDAIPWVYRAHTVAAGLLLMPALAQITVSVLRLCRREKLHAYDLMRMLLISPIVRLCFKRASSTSPDVAVFVFGTVVAWEMCRLLYDTGENEKARDSTCAFLIVALSVCGISVKPSFAMLGTVASIVALAKLIAIWWVSAERRAVWLWLGRMAGIGLLVAGPFFARNVIASGYPIYPSTVFSVNVPWLLPSHTPISEAQMIRAWCIIPGAPPEQVLANWNWVLPWFKELVAYWRLEVDIPLIFTALGLMVWLSRLSGKRGAGRANSDILFLAAPLAALVFWFFTAPSPRFAGAAFWWLGGGTLTLAVRDHRGESNHVSGLAILLLSLVLAGGFHMKAERIVGPGSDGGFHPVPVVEMQTFETDSGLVMFVPKSGDQAWDAELPNTPYPQTGLELRRQNDLSSGFWMPGVSGRQKLEARGLKSEIVDQRTEVGR